MGIKKRTNPEASILGGANYFQKTMDRLPEEIPKLDRIWMALAGYNLGFVNIDLARELAEEKGLNSKKWSEVSLALKQILINRYGEESKQFVKHKEAIEYVNRIDLYYKTLSILDRSNELFMLTQN
jgi:membrane-bound lytic murein transglycosylase F